jgi:hypothetical protein
LYDPSTKPYTGLTALLEPDAYFRVWMSGGELKKVTLLLLLLRLMQLSDYSKGKTSA